MNLSSIDELQVRLFHVEEEISAARIAFEQACLAATAISGELAASKSATRGQLSSVERTVFDAALENVFTQKLPKPGVLVQRELPFRGQDTTDHYVESPFVDPFDCFDDAKPEVAFPFGEAESPDLAPLQGLFDAAPRSSRRSQTESEVEIEFPEEGGYRMRSRPRKGTKENEGLSS
jgi:hypothetical protein